MEALEKYLGRFADLHRNARAGMGYAPHKPVLLLAVLDEVERGGIQDNLVVINPELVASFRAYWRALVPSDTWQERMVYPFRYLLQDGFWELVLNGEPLTSKELGDPTSINQLKAKIDGARFTPDLWQILQDRVAVNALRTLLLRTYFDATRQDVQARMPADVLEYESAKLIENAQSKFRVRKVRETQDDSGYFVRHALFPRVIKSLYNERCAVCGLAARSSAGALIVDAVHIMPFYLFHNDDPRNGLALCKNHHWAFDAGWFAISEGYKVVASRHLENDSGFLTVGTPLYLPSSPKLAPALDALKWHNANIFLQ